MKKYTVDFRIDNQAQINGEQPYNDILDSDVIQEYIEAETEEEAIETAIQYIIDNNIMGYEFVDSDINSVTYHVFEDDENIRYVAVRAREVA